MNIFFTDPNPEIAAQALCLDHIRKQMIESAQMLANAFTLDQLLDAPFTQKGTPRRHSYLHHPCSKWVLAADKNFDWLLLHNLEIAELYRKIYKKSHFTESFVHWALNNIHLLNLPKHNTITRIPQCFSDFKPQLTGPDLFENYRQFYWLDKQFATWESYDRMPAWWPSRSDKYIAAPPACS